MATYERNVRRRVLSGCLLVSWDNSRKCSQIGRLPGGKLQPEQSRRARNLIVAHISRCNPSQPAVLQFTDGIGGRGDRLATAAIGVMPGVGGIGAICV